MRQLQRNMLVRDALLAKNRAGCVQMVMAPAR